MTTPKPATAALDETGPQRWRCHTCRQTVTTYVELVEPPTCHGGRRHRPIPMHPDNDPPETAMTRPPL